MSSRSAFAIGLEPMAPQWPTLANLHHVGAAAGTHLLRRFDQLLDARQMAKVAFGCRTSGPAIGIAFGQRIPRSLGFRDGRFQILESQLALV